MAAHGAPGVAQRGVGMAVQPSEIRPGAEFFLERTCEKTTPVYYAAAGGDFNPIHIDPEVGRAAGLGGPILQGMCTFAWAVEAAVAYVGDPTRVTKVKARFTRPVLIGDTVRIRGRVLSVEGGRMTAELAAVNQRGEDVMRNGIVECRTGEGA